MSSGNIAVAVYDNTGTGVNAKPNNRKATSGAVPCPAAYAAADVPLDAAIDVVAGDWLAFITDNATANFHQAPTGPSNANNIGGGLCGYSGAAGQFPPPPVFGAWSPAINRQVWMLGVE